MLTVADVLEGLTGSTPPADWQPGHTPIRQVVIDSRQAVADSLFVALPGQHVDGHEYVRAALERGALVALVQRSPAFDCSLIELDDWHLRRDLTGAGFPVCIKVPDTLQGLQKLAAYWRTKFKVRVVAITGSIGKSTTKELTWAVLRRRFNTLRSVGNLNNEIGLPLTLLSLDGSHQRVVLEMGMYDLGEISQLCAVARPQVGVVTNVGPSHLERLGNIERIAQAKAELVRALPPDGVAVLNYDDTRVRRMAELAACPVFGYGLTPEADLWADNVVSEGLEGTRFTLHYRSERLHAKVPLLGRHSVHTALGATAVGLIEGMGWEDILKGLEDSTVQLRLVSVPGINDSLVLDDTYNASPVSTIAALNLLDELTISGRKIAVLGDMAELGEFERDGHRKVGCRAADVVAVLVTVGRRAHLIAEEARACGLASDRVVEVTSNDEAVARLRDLVQPGDIVLVKGSRSMAMEEIVAGLQIPTSRVP
jgi:UDP-N-acetylmuramoyl-tripeptide--D-alanyl-D-alanine ligase